MMSSGPAFYGCFRSGWNAPPHTGLKRGPSVERPTGFIRHHSECSLCDLKRTLGTLPPSPFVSAFDFFGRESSSGFANQGIESSVFVGANPVGIVDGLLSPRMQ